MKKMHMICVGTAIGNINKPVGRAMVLLPNGSSLTIEGICNGVIETANQTHFIIGNISVGEGTRVEKISI